MISHVPPWSGERFVSFSACPAWLAMPNAGASGNTVDPLFAQVGKSSRKRVVADVREGGLSMCFGKLQDTPMGNLEAALRFCSQP